MAQIKAAFTHLAQTDPDQVAHSCLQTNVDDVEINQHGLGIIIRIVIVAAEQKERTHNQEKTDGIRLYNIAALKPASLQTFGRIQIKRQIQRQI